MRARWGAALALVFGLLSADASADGSRILTLRYTPTARAQIAVWVESADGQFMGTVRLTEAVARRGIGNRPGALQMNSGFRWPYGRREGTLPVWAHRRASAEDAALFPRVIFQDRVSEGYASRTSSDQSRDDYFCLSFDRDTTTREALDAVTCASVFNSDKGRFVTEADVTEQYNEPYFEVGGDPRALDTRPLDEHSLYPPRLDATGDGGNDHPDVADFAARARDVMPDIDAVTMATPAGESAQAVQFVVPDAWPNGEYRVFLEINVEGDYAEGHDATTYPSPQNSGYDSWARSYGYPYRGQPSVVFSAPFSLGGNDGRAVTISPLGYASIHGSTGAMTEMDGSIVDDPTNAPGSGADRLRMITEGGAPFRFAAEIVSNDVCAGPTPPPECGVECDTSRPCADGFVCSGGACVGACEVDAPPPAVTALAVLNVDDVKQAHHWGRLHFETVTAAQHRAVQEYEVRVSETPIVTEEDFLRGVPAKPATIEDVALQICSAGVCPEGALDVGVGHLRPQTTHYVAVRAHDSCGAAGAIAVTEVTTTPIHFTTVSPCFVATAAYGTPMADEIRVLRRFRDRHLRTHPLGQRLVDLYYDHGPDAAAVIRERPWARRAVRGLLAPVIAWLRE